MKKETVVLLVALAVFAGGVVWYNKRKADPTNW